MTIFEKLADRAEQTRDWAIRTDGYSPWPWPGGQKERDNWRATVRRRMKAEKEENDVISSI